MSVAKVSNQASASPKPAAAPAASKPAHNVKI